MSNKEICKQYVSQEFRATPIRNVLSKDKERGMEYIEKTHKLVGWKHINNVDIHNLYSGWSALTKLFGRRQDYTTVFGWGNRTAMWVLRVGPDICLVLNNKRGTAFECNPNADAFAIVDELYKIYYNE